MKKLWQSWTIWFNGALAAIAMGLPYAMDQLPMLQAVVPASIYEWLLRIVVVGNFILRLKTNTGIALKGTK